MSDYNGPSESVRVRFTRDWFDVKAGTECVATWYPELKHHYVCVPSSDRKALRNGQIYGNHPLHDGLLERVDWSLPRKKGGA